MANKREEPKYKIEAKTYTYKKNGTDEKGRPILEQIGEPKTTQVKGVDNFKGLKKHLFDKYKGDDSVRVNFEPQTLTVEKSFGKVQRIRKNPLKIKNVKKEYSNGSVQITYYNAVKSKK